VCLPLTLGASMIGLTLGAMRSVYIKKQSNGERIVDNKAAMCIQSCLWTIKPYQR
jgi:hypothetical protein